MRPTTARLSGTELAVSETDPLQLQIAKIVAHLNQLTEGRLPQIEDSITAVKREIARVAGDLSAMDQQTRDHIERKFADYDRRLDAKQVLDLRWAIWGLVITTAGVVMSL